MMMRFLWFVLRIAIVIAVTLMVYSFVHEFVWTTLAFSRAYLGWFAAMTVAGTIAAIAGMALAGALLSEWKL